MPNTRHIGLSLGADLCWPAAFEDILAAFDPQITLDGEDVDFSVERVTVEPFDLEYTPRYDLVIDRITHWFMTSREWVKKICLMDDVYVLNNPWSIQSMEKHTSYAAMMRLGMPIPKTWMIPPKDYVDEGDVRVTVHRYNRLFDLATVGDEVGYPAFLKPYDGGGWVGVTRVTDKKSLHEAYNRSGTRVHHLQEAVKGWDLFVRGIGIGPQVLLAKYDPDQPLHGRYVPEAEVLSGEQAEQARAITRVINAFHGWDFNSCEMLRAAETLHPIDFANACPDSQVSSIHYYFPQLVIALLKWSLFCAATKRKPTLNLEWRRYFEIADQDLSFEEKLAAYDAIAREHFDQERFEAFCDEHLTGLHAVAHAYFGTPRFRDIVRAKTASLYPEHEVELFSNHFFDLVGRWRDDHPVS